MLKMIPCVRAEDMPQDVEDWCIENDVSLHYQNDVVIFHRSAENPFTEWLDLDFNGENYIYVAIIAT
jgi:hypothetical protein